MSSKTLNIIYRVCDSVSGTNGVRNAGSKIDILWASFHSLLNSISYAKDNELENGINLNIVFDNTSQETVEKMKSEASKVSDKALIKVFFTSDAGLSGNVGSFKLCYALAMKLSGYIFFLEDDYPLEKECILEMCHFLSLWDDSSHICLKPHQEIAEFTRDGVDKDGKYFKREVFLSESRYWIRIKKSTCTFLIDDFILKDCEDLFLKTMARSRLDETYLNQIFEKYPLFSPIEPLADHAHNIGGMRPYLNGRKLKLGFKYSTKSIT